MTTPAPLPSPRRPWLVYGALIGILAVGAFFRFSALGWGLRHEAEPDEKVFVENAARMAADRSLDHEYYYYPGLPFDLFAIVLGLRGTPRSPDPGAYLAVRAVLALMSTASVALVFLLGRTRVGVAAGLAGALFLAVSPVDIYVPHKVRPDAMLGTFALLALLAVGSLGKSTTADALAGVALGAASAVKFSAILLGPSVVLSWLAASRRRWSSLVILCAVATVVYFLLTPYGLVNAREFVVGMVGQFEHHYGQRVMSYWQMVLVYFAVFAKAFGPAALLAILALPLAAKDWRRWAPLVAFPVTAIIVFSTSGVRHERFVEPTFGIVALLAGAFVQAVARRQAIAGAGLALVAAALPFSESLAQNKDLARPGTMDRALDWIEASVPPRSKVLSFILPLGLDPKRYEVFPATVSTGILPHLEESWLSLGPYVAPQADYVIASPGNPLHDVAVRGLERTFRAEPDSVLAGPPIDVYRVPDSARLRYDRLPSSELGLSASENAADLPSLLDGKLDTAWATSGEQRAGQWIEARWDKPVTLARVVLDLGTKPQRWGRRLELSVTTDGKEWKRIFSTLASGPISDANLEAGPSQQILVFEPTCARGVRIQQRGLSERRWWVAELGLDAAKASCDPAP